MLPSTCVSSKSAVLCAVLLFALLQVAWPLEILSSPLCCIVVCTVASCMACGSPPIVGLSCTGLQVCHSSWGWPQAKLQHLCHEVRPENHREGCQLGGNPAQQAGQPDPLVPTGQVLGTWRSQGIIIQCCCRSIPGCALAHYSFWSSVTCIMHLHNTSAQFALSLRYSGRSAPVV